MSKLIRYAGLAVLLAMPIRAYAQNAQVTGSVKGTSAAVIPGAIDVARRAARDAQPLVRLAALRVVEALPASERASLAAPLLSDPLRSIRIEAARVLAPAVPGSGALGSEPAWRRAADEFAAAQRYNADRPEANVLLGTFDGALGRLSEAEAAFEGARTLDPAFVPAYVNAADVLRAAGREAEAVDMLRAGLAVVPDNPALHYALGLWHARNEQRADALRELERAVTLAPSEAHYAYVYAIALNSFGRNRDAIKVLERAAPRWPRQHDVQIALTTLQRDAGRRDAARKAAQRFLEASPGDGDARALLRSLD